MLHTSLLKYNIYTELLSDFCRLKQPLPLIQKLNKQLHNTHEHDFYLVQMSVSVYLSFLSSSCLSRIVKAVARTLIEVNIFTTSELLSIWKQKINDSK